MAEGAVAYGLWLDQKGKVIADSHVQKLADNEYLVVSFSLSAPELMARLQNYLIAEEAEVLNESDRWNGLLLWGEEPEVLRAPVGVLNLPSRRAGTRSVQWLVPMEQTREVMESLKAQATRQGDWAAVELARLRAGVPTVPRDIGPRDLPNEGALDEVAISYTKGCYLGQEVMARLKNLGQVRRRLHLVQGRGSPPSSGAKLYQGGRQVGESRSAAADGGQFLAMAMLSTVQLDPGAGLGFSPDAGAELEILRRV